MSDYGTMQSNIATFLRRDDLSSEIPIAIKRAIAHYSNEDWPWLQARTTASITTSSSTKTVTIPSDFKSVVTLLVTVNSAKYELYQRTQKEIEELYYDESLTEIPLRYAIWDGNFYLYPIPDDTYVLTLDYYQELTELANSTDSNEWTTTAEELIEARACWWLANRVMRNMELANSFKEAELEAYQRLRANATLQISSGRLRPTP